MLSLYVSQNILCLSNLIIKNIFTSKKLASAHALKEEFFEAMQSKTRLEALSSLTTWISHAENSNLPRFVSVACTMN